MSDDIKYGVFSWGPCIVQLKISEDFRKKLLSEAEESKKDELKFTTKLAGVIKEEYAYRQKEIFLPEISDHLTSSPSLAKTEPGIPIGNLDTPPELSNKISPRVVNTAAVSP